jgi:ABC-2 type transport system ATP-binding protein
MAPAYMKINDLTKIFGGVTALNELSLEVNAGEIYAFLGPNGAGKTTTLRCAVGLLKPDSGSVEIGGEEVALDKIEFRKKIAYIPDRPYLYEKLTAWEYLTFIAEVRELKNWEDEARRYFKFFQIEEAAHRLIEGFSHGMKQKLVIASSLLHKPELLLVDEPMVGLDPKSSRDVKNLFKKLAGDGCALFLSTHSLDMAEELATRIGIINKGRLLAQGTMDELREHAKSPGSGLEDVFLDITEEMPDES